MSKNFYLDNRNFLNATVTVVAAGEMEAKSS